MSNAAKSPNTSSSRRIVSLVGRIDSDLPLRRNLRCVATKVAATARTWASAIIAIAPLC